MVEDFIKWVVRGWESRYVWLLLHQGLAVGEVKLDLILRTTSETGDL